MKRILALFLAPILALGILALAVTLPAARPAVIAPPDKVVQNFITQLAAARYENAQTSLTDDLANQFTPPQLQALDLALRARLGAYRFQLGDTEQTSTPPDTTYQLHLNTERAGEQVVPIPLTQDPQTHLWQIASLDALTALTAP